MNTDRAERRAIASRASQVLDNTLISTRGAHETVNSVETSGIM